MLIRNAIQTPDGTILESRHRHDYVTYVDANGKEYMVDGGLDYERSSFNGDEKYLFVYEDDPHEVAREALTWGTYGKEGGDKLRRVKLSEMSNAHIKACIETQKRMYPQIRRAMTNELEYREVNKIIIED